MEHNIDIKKHTFIVMGEEHYTPLGAIRSLGEEGIFPVAIILRSKGPRVASLSKYISKLHMVDTYEEGCEILLKEYGKTTPKPFVIPCDDIVTGCVDRRYDEMKDHFFISNAGKNGRIEEFLDKKRSNQLAAQYGIHVAKTWDIIGGGVPEDIIYPVITKPAQSYKGWKQDYYVCNNLSELTEALRKTNGRNIFLQQYIQKTNELCIDGISVNKGQDLFISIASSYTYILPDYYSMEMIVRNFDNQNLQESLQKMFQEIGYEGIFCVEFMIDQNDELWFLEINFRNSGWSYASTAVHMNLPLLWAEGMLLGSIPDNAYKPIPDGFKAMAEISDFEQRVRKHKMIRFREWFREVKSCDCLYVYNKNDNKPFYSIWRYKLFHVIFTKIRNILHLHNSYDT